MTVRARLALATLALLAIVAIAYAPVRHGVFIWDDHALVETNPLVQKGALFDIFKQPFWTADPMSDARPAYYRPLAVVSLRADFLVAGDDAPMFHVTNVVLHLLATALLVIVARRLGATPTASVLSAGVWALLPRSTESVAWIAGRTDVLAAVMVMVALAVWPWDLARPPESPSPSFVRARAGAAAVAILLGLLAKEIAVAGVIAIIAGTIVRSRGQTNRLARVAARLAYVAAAVAAYALLRWFATRNVVSTSTSLGLGARAATILEALGRYCEMTLDPWHPATSIGLIGEVDRERVALGALMLLAALAFSARALASRRREAAASPPEAQDATGFAVAAGLGLGALALVIHLLPITIASGVAADRLLYLPLAGLAIAIAVGASRLAERTRRVVGALAIALSVTFVPTTSARAADYTNELRFRVVAAEHAHPGNTSAKSGLANKLLAATEVELACKLHVSARRSLERGGRTGSPRHRRALENLGGCYAMLGSYDRAAEVYRDLITLHPQNARAQMEIGYLHLHTFDLDEAETRLRQAVNADPTLEPAKRALAAITPARTELARLGTPEARHADPIAWARLLTRVGRVRDAIAAWAPLVVDPATPDDPGWEGLSLLLANADLATAQAAALRYFERDAINVPVGRTLLADRIREQTAIDALRARIEALAAK